MDAELVDLVARYVVRDVFVDDLPAAAVEALVRRVESPSLVLLAGASGREDPAEVWSLFRAALAELQIPVPTRRSAAELLKVSYARKVLTGTWSPRAAALKFVHLEQEMAAEIVNQNYVGDGLDIVAMVRAHYSYDDHLNVPDQESIDSMVVLECRRLVEVSPPSLTDAQVARLGRADLAALTRLCVACSAFFELVEGQAAGEATAAEILGPLEAQYAAGVRHVFGASVGDELVAVAELLQGYPSARDWYIGLLLVDPRYRRRGLGKRFCRAILDWIGRHDGAVVRLVVHQQNGDARRFWDQQGFVFERTRVKCSGRLEGPVSILKVDLLT